MEKTIQDERVVGRCNIDKMRRLRECQTLLKNTSSQNEKKRILEEYKSESDAEFNSIVIRFLFDDDVNFHITSKRVTEYPEYMFDQNVGDWSVLSTLRNVSESSGGNVNLFRCRSMYETLIQRFNEDEIADLFLNIIDKDFKCGVGKKLIMKVFPEYFKTFSVALSAKYSDYEGKVDFEKDTYYASRKMDGCRCIAILDENGKCKLISRQGKEFTTLGKIKDALESTHLTNVVFDGECCIVDEDGDEHFDWIMKEIRRKNHTIQNPLYQIFDVLSTDEFYGISKSKKLSERYEMIDEFFNSYDLPYLKNVKQTKVESFEMFEKLFSEAREKGWEGLIIRKDVPYEGKRTSDMLKCKSFYEDEYIVEGCNFGTMRYVEDGKVVEHDVMTDVEITHKGYKVNVGSGFSKEQRIKYNENPELIIGKTITVKYFEETSNQEGTVSLRFPTVKCVYENGRDV